MTKAQSPHVVSVHKDSSCWMPRLGAGRYSSSASSRASPLLRNEPHGRRAVGVEADAAGEGLMSSDE